MSKPPAKKNPSSVSKIAAKAATAAGGANVPGAMTPEEKNEYLQAALGGKIQFDPDSADAVIMESFGHAQAREQQARQALRQAQAAMQNAQVQIERAIGEAEASAKTLIKLEDKRRIATATKTAAAETKLVTKEPAKDGNAKDATANGTTKPEPAATQPEGAQA